VVDRVLSTLVEADLAAVIEALDIEACDILMKYVFRFMSKFTNCPLMLKLHSLLVEKAGVGSIVRALTDRKTV
jgi:ARP2/3 complex 16 kDa subunit (p16-Arc)